MAVAVPVILEVGQFRELFGALVQQHNEEVQAHPIGSGLINKMIQTTDVLYLFDTFFFRERTRQNKRR